MSVDEPVNEKKNASRACYFRNPKKQASSRYPLLVGVSNKWRNSLDRSNVDYGGTPDPFEFVRSMWLKVLKIWHALDNLIIYGIEIADLFLLCGSIWFLYVVLHFGWGMVWDWTVGTGRAVPNIPIGLSRGPTVENLGPQCAVIWKMITNQWNKSIWLLWQCGGST